MNNNFIVRSFLLIFFALTPGYVFGATINVDSNCNLVDAVLSANQDIAVSGCVSGNGSDTINIYNNISLNNNFSGGENSLPQISSNITINGNGYTVLNDQSLSQSPFRIFEVLPGYILAIKNTNFDNISSEMNLNYGGLIKADGAIVSLGGVSAQNFNVDSRGSVIHAQNTLVSVKGGIFQNNYTGYGGVFYGYAEDGGQFNFEGVRVIDNNADGHGAGIRTEGNVTTNINNSIFKNNHANYAGAISNNGSTSSKLFISNTEFENNTSNQYGGAIVWGGVNGEVVIKNTTFVNNSAGMGGGAFENAGIENYIKIINSTFSNNSSAQGGAAFLNFGSNTTLEMAYNSFVSNSSNDSLGIFTSSGNGSFINSVFENNLFYQNEGEDCQLNSIEGINFVGNLSSGGVCGNIDASGVSLNLAQNGGFTRTHALSQNSNVIDGAITDNGLIRIPCPAYDQRGYQRPLDGNGDGVFKCDVGSFEFKKKPGFLVSDVKSSQTSKIIKR